MLDFFNCQFLCLIICVYIYVAGIGIGSKLSSSPASSTSASLVSAMPAFVLSVKTFSLAEVEKATEKFSLKKVLGEGGFGRVYHGVMDDGTEIAVKLLTRGIQNGGREFIAEVEMLSRLHHRNLVKLIGTCIEKQIRCLIYELVPNGSLESHLHGNSFFFFFLNLINNTIQFFIITRREQARELVFIILRPVK